MKHPRGRIVDVDTLTEFDRRVGAGARHLAGWRISGVDLTGRSDVLGECDVAEALVLGCALADGAADRLRAGGALVMPAVPASPVDTYRAELYSPHELFDTPAYPDSLDARAYAWSQGRHDTDPSARQERTLAAALHDHAIDSALTRWVEDRTVVGVMGDHALPRGSAGYTAAADLGHALGSRHTVATGGGPGAMEAANLGALLSGRPRDDLSRALDRVARVPSFVPDVGAWADVALELVDDVGDGVPSLGVPTWHYGHEPPNVFATSIAKYFANAVREAVLLEICDAGIAFLPGAAGTVQEVFQDACENYYADPASVAPMVLVGVEHWTRTLPVWPLLEALARERHMGDHVHLVDDVDEAVALLG